MSNKTIEICCDEGTLPRNIISDVGKLGNQKKNTWKSYDDISIIQHFI